MSRSTTPLPPSAAAPRAGTRRFLSVALVVSLIALAAAGTADAGEWIQASCVNPDGTAAGSDGWVSMIAGGGYGSNASTVCSPGTPMYAAVASAVAVPVGSAETLRYIPPAGSTLDGGTVDVSMSADGFGADASGTAVLYTPEYAYDGSNVLFQCAAGLTLCSPGGNDYTGTLTIPPGRGGELYLSAGCGGTPGGYCDEGARNGAWSSVQLTSAMVRLANSSTPAATGIAGTLLEPAVRGTAQLTLDASDPAGPGVYRVTVRADGQTLYDATPDSNGGSCVPAAASEGIMVFDSSQPCRQSESVAAAVDSTVLHDGPHTLTVGVTDAAGNTAVVYDATMTTHNAPADTAAPALDSAAAPAGIPLTVSPGVWSAPAGTGPVTYGYRWQRCDGGGCADIPGATAPTYTPAAAEAGVTLRAVVAATDSDGSETAASAVSGPVTAAAPSVANGAGATRAARVTLTVPAAVTRPYARRALTVTGQLTGAAGRPIADAALELTSRTGPTAPVALGFVTTGPDGTFAVHVPPGPSRTVTVGYRAYSADGTYSAQATVTETVDALVRLTATPRRTGPAGTLLLTGRLAGPVPAGGVAVTLFVHYRGRWEPFRAARAGRDGRFVVRYRFEGAVGRFPFRAAILGTQAGYPYAPAASAPVDVSTG